MSGVNYAAGDGKVDINVTKHQLFITASFSDCSEFSVLGIDKLNEFYPVFLFKYFSEYFDDLSELIVTSKR